jgi:hypothetical protein
MAAPVPALSEPRERSDRTALGVACALVAEELPLPVSRLPIDHASEPPRAHEFSAPDEWNGCCIYAARWVDQRWLQGAGTSRSDLKDSERAGNVASGDGVCDDYRGSAQVCRTVGESWSGAGLGGAGSAVRATSVERPAS